MSRKEHPGSNKVYLENGFEFVTYLGKYTKKTPPPSRIPNDLYDAYTMERKIPVLSNYFDNSKKDLIFDGNVDSTLRISKDDYIRAFELFDKKAFLYYSREIDALYDVFNQYSLADKTVLIWGLPFMNCEAFALWKNAKHVYVVDCNKPICEHEKVTVLSLDELKKSKITTDLAISYSSFEHNGLGRYGDALDPDGDLHAMAEAHNFLDDDGLLFLAIPFGRDCLEWNSNRVYGKLRLPLLLKGWHCIDVFNAQKAYVTSPDYPFDAPFGAYVQFLMVCKKIETDYPEDSVLKQDIKCSTPHHVTHSPDICKRINSVILEYKNNYK